MRLLRHWRFLLVLGALVLLGDWATAVVMNVLKVLFHAEGAAADPFRVSLKDFAPLGAVAIVAASLLAEARILGWEGSSLRRLLERRTRSVKTDLYYLVVYCSNVVVPLQVLFTFGGVLCFQVHAQSRFGWGVLSGAPWWLAFCAQWVVGSFLFYVQHWVQHTWAMWEFHKLHHAAEEMDMANNFRAHPLSYALRTFVETIPAVMLGVDPTVVLAYSAVTGVLVLWQHSDVDWDLPWVERYLFIGSRGHRIHHSVSERHYDKNLGFLVFWDWLFGTLYVETGLDPVVIGVVDPLHNSWGATREMFAVFFSSLRAFAAAVTSPAPRRPGMP